MVVIGIIIVALEIAVLGAVLAGTMFLARENRRRFVGMTGELAAVRAVLEELRREVGGMTGELAAVRAVLEELQREVGGMTSELAAVRAVLEELRREAGGMEKAPDRPADAVEAAMSKAVEDGISSILSYAVGKVSGVELRL